MGERPPAGPYGQVLATIGDISVTQTHVVTPSGAYPITGTSWTVQDRVQSRTSVPGWAILLTIVFFLFCFLGLIFLTVKRQTLSGVVEVTLQGPGLFHVTQVPVRKPSAMDNVHQQVNYARSLAAGTGGTPPLMSLGPPGPAGLPALPSPPGSGPASAPPATPRAPSVSFNDSRSHWYDGSSWRDARREVPPDAAVDREKNAWWDGAGWRPLP
jgi:hypothetical protein